MNIAGMKVYVMSFVDCSDVEIYATREAAFERAVQSLAESNFQDDIPKDLKFLIEEYKKGYDGFYVEDWLWVDPVVIKGGICEQ